MKSSTALASLVACCRKLARRQHTPDSQLVQRLVGQRDDAAFEELVDRYAPLVWSVCRRIVPSEADCEDAFQAAFLVLFRRAGSIDPKRPLGPWLHGVAVHTALKAEARSARHRPHGIIPEQATTGDVADELGRQELFRVVDAEIARLPRLLQAPFVLCCLEGRTRDEAAAALGCSVAAVKSRLERGRNLLRQRLERRGIGLPTAFLVIGLSGSRVDAALRAKALQSLLGSAPAAVAALVPAAGATLVTKLTLTTISIVVVGTMTFGAFRVMQGNPSPGALAAHEGSAFASRSPAASEKVGPRVDGLGDPLPSQAVLRLGSSRLRPGGIVRLLAISPDGSKLAVLSREQFTDESLSIWDTRTGRLLRRMDMPGGAHALTWRPDSRRVVLLQGESLLVWDYTDEKADVKSTPRIVARGGKVARPGGAGGPPADNEGDSCYALSPDGQTIAVGRSGNRYDKERPIRLLSLQSDHPQDKQPTATELARQPGNCAILSFTPDGTKLVAINQAKQLPGNRQEDKQLVVVWDIAKGKEIVRFTAPRPASNPRAVVAVSNRLLALGLEDGAASLWDLASGKERRLDTDHVGKKPGQGFGTFAAAFASDGAKLVTGGRDGLVKVWDAASGRRLHTLERHYSWVETLTVSDDGRTIASSGQDGLIRLWDAASGADACPQAGHKYMVLQTVITPDAKIAVTAGGNRTLRWWNMTNGLQIRTVELPSSFLVGLAISPDGRTVLGAVHEEHLHTWDLATGRETTPANLPRQKVGALAFTPDGRHFVSASGSQVNLWEWPALKLVRTLELPKPAKSPGENECQGVAISPDGRWLVTVAERSWYREENGLRFGFAADGIVDLWDFGAGKRVRRLAEGQGVFNSAAFTADGRLVLMGGSGNFIPAEGSRSAQKLQGEIHLLDPVATRLVRAFTTLPPTPGVQHRYIGTTLLTPDGRMLYVSYSTGAIVAFEVATGQPRHTLSGHLGYVGALGCVPDGKRLISGGIDGAALVWDVTLAAATPRKEPLDAAAVEKLWKTATQTEAREAYSALANLAAAPEQAVALLRKQIKPIPEGPTDAELDRLFEKMDSDDFATREKATRDLEAFGESAVPGVRKRLVPGASLELRLRALAFLDRFDHKELSSERLRQLRAVELLENIGTPAAKQLLLELARGAPGVPLTLEATAALTRLAREIAKK